MIKKILKLALCLVVYTITISVLGAVLPSSPGFKEMTASGNPTDILYLLLNGIYVCFVVYFLFMHSFYKGVKQYACIVSVVFFIQSFMTQIETLLFIGAFPALAVSDVLFFMVRDLLVLLAVTALAMRLFRKEKASMPAIEAEKRDTRVKSILAKMGIIGIIYMFVYLLFGYFVAWQFAELREFYSGSAEKLNFFRQMAFNIQSRPILIPFQFLRGILFSAFILPLLFMINTRKLFIASVCLVYLSTAILLVIPNVLFPTMVRIGHLLEMTSSMLLFGFIAANIMWIKKKEPVGQV